MAWSERAQRAVLLWVISVTALTGSVAACSNTDPDAATVDVTITDPVLRFDSRSACLVQVRPAPAGASGEVSKVFDCFDPRGELGRGQVSVPAGRYIVQVSQWGCPGMPGACSEDPQDAMYRSAGQGGQYSADWSCAVEVTLGPHGSGAVVASGGGSATTATCRIS